MSSRWPILAIFVLSGAAGLVYEIVWSRQLVLVFGNTTQAVSAILAGFFGGMAIGSAIGGRLADRVRSPLRLYGQIELVLVVVVIATPLTFRIIRTFYGELAVALEDAPQLLAFIRLGLALLALAPATVLMGATLPTLTRHLSAHAHLSESFGRLYAANTIGAIIGTLRGGSHPDRDVRAHRGAVDRCGLLGRSPDWWPSRSTGGARMPRRRRRERRRAERRRAGRCRPAAGRRAVDREPRGPTRHGPTHARPDRGLHLGPDVARLPGALDAAPGVGDRQHHLRVHGDPRDLPDRPCHRSAALQLHPPSDGRPGPPARDLPDPRRGPGHARSRRCRRAAGGAVTGSIARDAARACRGGDPRRPAGDDRPRPELPGVVGAAGRRRPTRRQRIGVAGRGQHRRRDRRRACSSRSS